MFLNYPPTELASRPAASPRIIHEYKDFIVRVTTLREKVRNLILNLENRGERKIVAKLSLRDKLNDIFIELRTALKVIQNQN